MHPFLAPDFAVRWSTLVSEAIVPDITLALEHAKAALDAIGSQDKQFLTYESTFLALEQATEELGRGWGRLQHLDSVCDHPAQREALNQMLPAVSDFYSSIALHSRLWDVLKSFGDSPAVSTLSPIRQRHVHETMADFRESGADLPEETKQRIAAIDAELSVVTKQYGEHVLDSTNAWELVITEEARLAGLPDSAKAAAAANARHKGHGTEDAPAWRFTLQFPSLFPILQYAHDDSLRSEVWQASVAVGAHGDFDNTELVWKILRLRHEKAQCLGRDHFADLVLQRRMARDGATALDFVDRLHERIQTAFHREFDELVAYKQSHGSEPSPGLEPWETTYWAERRRKQSYDLDEEALRPYFPVDGVMSGMFEIATQLFGISIRPRDTVFLQPGESAPDHAVEVWHPEVTFYEIHDSETNAHLGSFYADWHPRESKRGGAWMNSLHTGRQGEPHLGLIVGNMTPPIDGQRALLTHNEVETIFHEFGHLLHGLLSEVPVPSLAGTNVAWDFVELPSQLMENFCWERTSLDRFARHHETGAPIPDDLFSRMIAAKNYMSATACMRQLASAKIDLELHTQPPDGHGHDLDALDRRILARYRAPLHTESPTLLRRFNHVFSSPVGYASGYYSYKWAEVLDADAFTRFQREGILNPETGRAFRRHILSQGNAAAPDELYRRFMGQDPNLEPLLARSGLAASTMA